MKKYLFVSCLLCLMLTKTRAQFDSLQHRIEAQDSLADLQGREKIFIHCDKPQYQLNDTMWLKGYVVSGTLNAVNDSSRIAYLEWIDANGVLVKRISTPCDLGLFYCDITLGSRLFSQGVYTLRAYTERMRGFGDSLFFQRTVTIIDPKAKLWQATLKDCSFAGNRLFIAAGLQSAGYEPLPNSRVAVSLVAKNRILFRKSMLTDARGNLYIDTLLKTTGSNERLYLKIENKELNLKIPLPDNNRNIDLQFLPEGGNLVAGYRQRLGFKALNLYGKGIDVKGVIKDSKGNAVVSFASVYNGMGIVELTPLQGEVYTACLDNGSTYKIPPAETTGWLLQVSYSAQADSILIQVETNDPADSTGCFITGSTRGYHFLKGRLRRKKQYEIRLAATTLLSGVARFTLYNAHGRPMNERALFVWHKDDLKLQLTAHKAIYDIKDSVALSLVAKNELDENTMGSFSVAVIDTSQVPFQADAENIVSYMALSADLKGTVETPYYFIKNPTGIATDALMLTQGWVKYDFSGLPEKYPYEQAFGIQGKVTNIFNKPLPHTTVTLFGRDGRKRLFLKDTLTDKDGRFYFSNFPPFFTDSVSTLIKAVNKKGKSSGVGVDVFSKDYPKIPETIILSDAGSILLDTAAKKAIDRRSAVMEQWRREGRFLEEVIVTAKARIPGSKNLNEDGGADQTITQAVLEQTPKENLLTILTKQIPGFPGARGMSFSIGTSRIEIVMDGMNLGFFEMNPFEVLQYYLAEDVKSIEVMKSDRYTGAYQVRFNPDGKVDFMNPPVFIEITTYGGVGPFLNRVPGTYLLKPNAPFAGRLFYSPKYSTPDEETTFPDLRQTVYWNADVVTDQNGEARIAFYTSESKGDYVVIVQGTDLKGGFGTLIAPLKIKKENKP